MGANQDAHSANTAEMRKAENDARCERAFRAILQPYEFENDDESAITDALVDLLHLCDQYGIDAENMHARIWRHYVAERSV